MSREPRNPSAIGGLGARSFPLGPKYEEKRAAPKMRRDMLSRRGGWQRSASNRNKGNAPWLKIRRRMRKPAFRNM